MTLEEYEAARTEDVRKNGGFYPGANNPLETMKQNFEGLSTPGLAYADFAMDAVGTLGAPIGLDKLDDRWDEATQLDNPVYQKTREVLSVVLPAIQAGKITNQGLTKLGVNNYPAVQRWLMKVGAFGLADGLVALMSDTSEEENAARVVSDMLPGTFGPKGYLPLPESWKTKESNSPEANKVLHFYENLGLSTIGTTIGYFIDMKSAVKTPVDFIKPID